MKKITISIIIAFLFIGNVLNAQWIEVDSGYDSPWIFYGMSIPPGQNDIGYIAGMYTTYNGDGVILKTEDGGMTWTTIHGGTSGTIDGLQAICFIDDDTGFAGGWNEYFIKTTDGGDTWTEVTVGTNVWYFTDIEFWDDDNGVACASMDGGGQPVFITDDGGDTWSQATSGISQSPLDITYADANTLYLVGNGGSIDKSTDGGYTWSSIYQASGITFGVDFEGTQFGVVGGEDGEMLATMNGGSSWSSYATGYENLWAAKAFTGDSAYIGGTDENIYKTLDGGDTWQVEFNGPPESSLYKFAYTLNNTGFVSGSSGKIFYKEAPLGAEFEADYTTVCAGSSVSFTDLSSAAISWDWEFSGGTPSTSTDQNPTVTYNTPGEYNVELTVSDGTNYDTELKVGYIIVIDTPEQAGTPEGESDVCTGSYYVYTIDEVDYAEDYEWELLPEDAGLLEGSGATINFSVDDEWTGDFTLRVRATNMCGDGEWSDYLEGTISTSPEEYTLEGGGGFCLDGDGVEITLDGSQSGVDYELYLDGEATGNIVEGTGSELSFGLVTDEGFYTCEGSNENCSQTMVEQVEVYIMFPPMEPATPTGPILVCDETSSDYTTEGSEDADTYSWTLTPEEAGTISGDGLVATIEWDTEYAGTAYVSVSAANDCGEGNSSESLEVELGSPFPEISGEELVCDLHEEMYEVEEHVGSSYTWEVTGGEVTEGQGTYMVTITWGEPGDGTINVEEETASGCSGSSDEFSVTIDDCTGIDESIEDGILSLYPNPTSDMLTVDFETSEIEIIVSVCNQLGQRIISQEINNANKLKSTQFNTSALTSGLYFIKIESKNGLLKHKQFIKR